MSLQAQSAKPWLDFPTKNHTLIDGDPSDFFMYVHRDFGGVRSKPWQGGQYGYVRGPRQINGEVVFAAMHEGLDIKPLQRDAKGEPLDSIHAAADGRVAYVNRTANASNYGRYVVIEHIIAGSSYYTLYAHLSSASVEVDQSVRQGDQIGVMGHTGVGIDRERAHVHFEFCLMLTRHFDDWTKEFEPRDPNRHGNFNGRNLAGIDPAKLLRAIPHLPSSQLASFIASEPPAFKIYIPDSPNFDLIEMYPWLLNGYTGPRPPAWTVTFSQYAVPIKVEPLKVAIGEPQLAGVRPSKFDYKYTTRGMVTGTGDHPRLTEAGQRLGNLLIYPRPTVFP